MATGSVKAQNSFSGVVFKTLCRETLLSDITKKLFLLIWLFGYARFLKWLLLHHHQHKDEDNKKKNHCVNAAEIRANCDFVESLIQEHCVMAKYSMFNFRCSVIWHYSRYGD